MSRIEFVMHLIVVYERETDGSSGLKTMHKEEEVCCTCKL
jgi:hypothetical protein